MKKTDLLTIVSLSGLSWVILMVSHELIGHGGACVLIGGTPKYFDAMYFIGDYPNDNIWQDKFVKAGGSLINIFWGLIAILWFNKLKIKNSWLGFFLWISIMINFLQTGNYIAFGRFIHESMDWAIILEGLNPLWLWKLIELISGILIIAAGLFYGRKYHSYFIQNKQPILKQNLRLLILPLITITMVSISAAYFVPSKDRFMMIMGGIGNSLFFLFGMLILALLPLKRLNSKSDFSPKGNFKIIIPSLFVTLLYIFVISKGINL